MAKILKIRPQTKHIVIKYHHFRTCTKKGNILLEKINTAEQEVDFLMKPLEVFWLFCCFITILFENQILFFISSDIGLILLISAHFCLACVCIVYTVHYSMFHAQNVRPFSHIQIGVLCVEKCW